MWSRELHLPKASKPVPGLEIKKRNEESFPYLFTMGTALPEFKEDIMEVLKESEVTQYQIDSMIQEGCFVKPYTVNGEAWIYIVHPVKGKGNK